MSLIEIDEHQLLTLQGSGAKQVVLAPGGHVILQAAAFPCFISPNDAL